MLKSNARFAGSKGKTRATTNLDLLFTLLQLDCTWNGLLLIGETSLPNLLLMAGSMIVLSLQPCFVATYPEVSLPLLAPYYFQGALYLSPPTQRSTQSLHL